MAITQDDFEKVWASQSPLTPYSFTDSNYKEGWNFVGATPPSRQMWDSLQKNNDEKSKYLYDSVDTINTRLGTILEASGNDTTVSANAILCSITTHPAGAFLITSHMDLNYNGSGVYVNSIKTANHGSVSTRNISNGGGGNCAVLLTELDENEVVDLQGYQTESGTMRGTLKMVQLA